MTSDEWKDLIIGFDELGFQPATLCDFEKEIKKYQIAFKDVLKYLEILEILKKWFLENTVDYRDYDNTLFIDTFIRKEEEIFKILEEWLDEPKN